MDAKQLYRKNQVVTYKGRLHIILRSHLVDPILGQTYYVYDITTVKKMPGGSVLYDIKERFLLPVTAKEYKKLCEKERIPKWQR